MAIEIKSWSVATFRTSFENGTLITNQEYQRRPVWKIKDKMLLIDSLARGVPVGAITLYADESRGFRTYEVIDGKQRLGAILSFLRGEFTILTEAIKGSAIDEDEFDLDADPVVAEFHGRRYSDLDIKTRLKFDQYELPVFIVSGVRADAIRAFTRMNSTNYSLKPQEIRNAFYAGSAFLRCAIEVCDELTSGVDAESFFIELGAVTKAQFDRMQDIQLASELLALRLDGPQHRRDTLNDFYELYSSKSGEAFNRLSQAKEWLVKCLRQIYAIFGAPLAANNMRNGEHDLYALVGAFSRHGLLNKVQQETLGEELKAVIAEFFRQVVEYTYSIRTGADISPDDVSELAQEYARGFFGGQINAKVKREQRIAILDSVIGSLVATTDPRATFTDEQRRIIWARSQDKLCGRCGKPVDWREFEAGHRVPHALGGRTVVDNGQVEHSSCNRAAGAS